MAVLMRRPANLRSAALVGAALALAWQAAGAEAPERYAIRAGKIVTVTQGTIDGGVLLVSDGKVEALGREGTVPIPDGYTLIDAPGRWVMPGMIEIHSHAGVDGGLNDMVCQLNPGMRIGDGVDAESKTVEAALAAGITTILSLPGSGTNHGGFGVAFKTAGATKAERLVRRVGAMKISQADNPERGAGDIGRTLMGMVWLLRQHFARLNALNDAWTAYERGDADGRPERDLALEYGLRAVRGEIPVLVHTWMTWGMSMTTRMFHDELGLKAIASHATGTGHLLGDVVAEKSFVVNVGPRVVDFYGNADGSIEGIAAAYDRAGARALSVNTDAFGYQQSLLPDKAAMGARFGMAHPDALRALTIEPARALFLEDRIGSIEVGKDADLVIKASSLLDPTTPVEMVFVDGRIAYEVEGAN